MTLCPDCGSSLTQPTPIGDRQPHPTHPAGRNRRPKLGEACWVECADGFCGWLALINYGEGDT